MAKFIKILAYIWGFIVLVIIIIAIIGNIVAIQERLPLYRYLLQVFLKITEPFNPFNILNFLMTVILFSPALILFWLSERIKNTK